MYFHPTIAQKQSMKHIFVVWSEKEQNDTEENVLFTKPQLLVQQAHHKAGRGVYVNGLLTLT